MFDPNEKMGNVVDFVSDLVSPSKLDLKLGNMVVQKEDGDWGELDGVPAIYLGHQDIPAPRYPLIYVIFDGSSGYGNGRYEDGLVEYPEGSGEFVPYTKKWINYSITLWAQSGDINQVYRGQVQSSNAILNRVSEALSSSYVSSDFIEKTNSGFDDQIDVNPSNFYRNNVEIESASLRILMNTVETTLYKDEGWFDTIKNINGTVEVK